MRSKTVLIAGIIIASCMSGCTNNTNSNFSSSNGLNDSISLNSASVAMGEPVSITATLIDGHSNPLDGKVITWYIDGNYVGKSQVKKGITMMSLSSSDTLLLGNKTHIIKVEFYGDQQYKPSTATTLLLLKGIPTQISNSSDSISLVESATPEYTGRAFNQ
jgi:hypothetical protein